MTTLGHYHPQRTRDISGTNSSTTSSWLDTTSPNRRATVSGHPKVPTLKLHCVVQLVPRHAFRQMSPLKARCFDLESLHRRYGKHRCSRWLLELEASLLGPQTLGFSSVGTQCYVRLTEPKCLLHPGEGCSVLAALSWPCALKQDTPTVSPDGSQGVVPWLQPVLIPLFCKEDIQAFGNDTNAKEPGILGALWWHF